MQFKKLNNIIGWLVFAIATFTYVATIEPTASFWDCGEYIACAYKLEVGHPPGAPFFLLVGRFFALLAGGDPAMAGKMINAMSALCSSFSILFLFWTITRLGTKALLNKGGEFTQARQWAVLGAGAVGALAYTFSDSFWFSAVEGEVYAMSSFFTAFVFWAVLKWDEEDDTNPISAMRWLVIIAYLMGLSIGVHLLNLLVIPAICFVYYFKKYKFQWKTFIITGIISLLLLGGIQNVMIPKIVKFAADYEILFVNRFGMGFNSGTIVYFLLLLSSLTSLIIYTVNKKESFYKFGFYTGILFAGLAALSGNGAGIFLRAVVLGGLLYGIHKLKSKSANTLNVILISFATLLIGYSSFFVLVIRSQANTPMDENDPENAITLLSYLNREQYGDWPITYGQYYNAPTKSQQYFKDGEPVYVKDEKTGKYKITDDRKKSIPVYEEEYCTVFPRMWSQQGNHEASYRYWGDVQSNHKKKVKMNEQTGQMEEVQIPTFTANLKYFFKYQLGYMYLRYFAWNFIGRQNDIQGLNNNPLEGNWKTGIKGVDDVLLDTDTSKVQHAASNNMASNSFYALPFILGLLGFFFQYKNDKGDTWVVSLLFLLTGLAIVIYLNQYPYQPRERDYAYAASFYAFAIWIGFGVLFIFDFLSKKSIKSGAIIATLIGLVIPTIMASQGWNDHNRSKRTMSRDFAVNYLNSCAPNAILFTNGDNDTFPLWYAQEVEGIRTDVRVVNLSLLQTDWYINQMRRAAYESAPVPFTIPAEKYVQGTRDVVYIMDKGTGAMNLEKAIDFVESDDFANKLDYGTRPLDYFPSKTFYVPVDSAAVMREKVISVKDTARLVKNIKWTINRQYITKNDLMVLDLIAHNDWKRPIYFAVTTGGDAYLGLEEYFQLEGLAYRLMPIKNTDDEMQQGGRVNTDAMYDNIMNKFLWGGLDKPGVNLDENCTRMASNMRMQMATLAGALINKGQKEKAEKVLDLCLAKMPDENVRYEATLYTVIAGYYQIGNMKKATELSSKLFDIYENDYKVYQSQKSPHKVAFNREIGQAREIMRRLVMLAEQFKQDAHSKDLMKRLTTIVPMEDLMPQEAEGPPQQQAEPVLQ